VISNIHKKGKMMRKNTSHLLFVTCLAAAFAVVTGASRAQAGDAKLYPGSMCVRWSGTTTPSYNVSAIGNPSSSSWLYVDCPVIKDAINGRPESATVQTVDMHYSADVSCNLLSGLRWFNRYAAWSSGARQTRGTDSFGARLSFGPVSANADSHYFFSCRIPPQYSGGTSYITSYRVDETY
jgi:hypothetical protein